MNKRACISESWAVILGPLVANLPRFILRENSHLPIYDYLDSNVAWFVILKRLPWGMGPLESVYQIMNGMPRVGLPSDLSLIYFIFKIFPPFWAIVVNDIIVRFIGALFMWLFLRELLLSANSKDRDIKLEIINWSVFMYSILPIFTIYGLSHYGFSIIMYIFLLIYKGRPLKIYHYLSLILLGFYSSPALTGYVFVSVLFAGAVIKIVSGIFHKLSHSRTDFKKDLYQAYQALFSTVVLGLSYMIAQWRLVYFLVYKPFTPHREEFFFRNIYTLSEFIYPFGVWLYLHNQSSWSLALPIITPVILLALVFAFSFNLNLYKKYLLILLASILTAALIAAISVTSIYDTVSNNISFLRGWSRLRTFWAEPTLFYAILAIALTVIRLTFKDVLKRDNIGRIVVAVIIGLQLSLVLGAQPDFGAFVYDFPSYKEYYSVNLFKEVEQVIGLPKDRYRVVSIGLTPAVSQYNGFYSLDAYSVLYPLEYKRKFYRFLRKELLKSPAEVKGLFISYGNQCYTYVSELSLSKDKASKIIAFFLGRFNDIDFINNIPANGWMIIFNSRWGNPFYVPKILCKKIKNLELDFSALKQVAPNFPIYVFSTVEILNYKEEGLEFIANVNDKDSPIEIYIYKVK